MQWVAYYSDGTALAQYDDGVESKYADIDRGRLAAFALFSDDQDSTPVLALHLDPGQRLIFRRRVEQSVRVGLRTIYLVGWQQTIHGQNVQSISYIFPDGSIHQAGRWRQDHPWFYEVELLAAELTPGLYEEQGVPA